MVVSANLLPNGKQQFSDGNGKPYASGKVYFYVPTTTTFKNTWSDPEKSSLNTNPVTLDANGEAVIFGDGEYRQILKDVNGNQIWDAISIQYITVGGDLSGTLPNPSVNPNLFINQFNTNKNPPVDADRFLALDSGNALAPIYFLWSQIKTAMQTALEVIFDARYAQATNIGLGFSNLKILVSSNAIAAITADSIVLFNSSNAGFTVRTVSVSANMGSTGTNGLDTGAEAASTFYYLWIIYNPTSMVTASLISLSATAPTMPTGFTYKALVGAVRNDASSNFWWMLQFGRRAEIVISSGGNPTTGIVITSGTSGNPAIPTYTTVSLANFVPAIASKIIGSAKLDISDVSGAIVAPNNGYGTAESANPPPVGSHSGTNVGYGATVSTPFEWNLQSLNIYYASNSTGAAVLLRGWELNF